MTWTGSTVRQAALGAAEQRPFPHGYRAGRMKTVAIVVLVAFAMTPVPASAETACATVLTCAPDTTFVCKWRDELDVRVYISSKLEMAYIGSTKSYGKHNKLEVLHHDQKNISVFVGNDPSTGSPRYLTLDPAKNEVVRVWAAEPATIPCQRLVGRHLDE